MAVRTIVVAAMTDHEPPQCTTIDRGGVVGPNARHTVGCPSWYTRTEYIVCPRPRTVIEGTATIC